MSIRTKTSAFGTSNRLGHDSKEFYDRKMFDKDRIESEVQSENLIPDTAINQIYCSSSESMTQLPDNCVHLVVTSPPYNVGKEYDEDLTLSEYAALLTRVFSECHRVLVHGGRICINVANVGRKPYIPLNALVSNLMSELEFQMRGEVIWNKGASAGVSCAWGSWMSPSNPVLRDVHEYVLIYSKGSFSRQNKKQATIEKEGFLEWTKSIWDIPAESARKVGHPAPFPVELPLRLIELYTYRDEVVLDPFMGAGSTAVASLTSHRNWIGYDIDESYCELTRKRVADWRANEPLFD